MMTEGMNRNCTTLLHRIISSYMFCYTIFDAYTNYISNDVTRNLWLV